MGMASVPGGVDAEYVSVTIAPVSLRLMMWSIDPVLVTVRVPLRTEFARFMLANSITLTPGTITVDADSDRFTVHCLHGRLIEGISDSTFVHLLQKMEG